MLKIKIPILILFFVTLFSCNKDEQSYENYVLMVSIDGCRWDYPDMYKTPVLNEIARSGVKAERVISSFPTKTFPNHYTIATGLYPDHHGLINNSFYAADIDKTYSIGNREMVSNPDFYGGEPIWNTAEKQGMISASFFWVGSETPIQGMQPTYWKPYDGSISFNDRVDTVIHWLKLPIEKRPRLVLLYFQEPDAIGHQFGPDHEKTGMVMEELDQVLGRLRKKLDRLPYGDKINLIITSDHGMCATSPERYVNIFEHIKQEWVARLVGGNPLYLIEPLVGFEDSILNHFENIEGVSVRKKEELPPHFHYGSHPRISRLVVLADSSWSVGTKPKMQGYTSGAHGYDNSNTDMHNIFIAEGPAFKNGYLQAPFENVNIYPLISHILSLEPAANDGDINKVRGMLKE